MRQWLGQTVIEDTGVDRPFKLRRVSVLLMAGGWGVFLASCLVGLWLVRHNVPVLGWRELLRGTDTPLDAALGLPLQWLRTGCEAVGAVLFVGGMLSVSFFDRRSGIPVFRAD